VSNQARFDIRMVDDMPIVEAWGELDMTNVSGFESLFAEAADQNRGVVTVSLAHVKYFDSRTIHALGMLAARLAKNRQKLAVVLPAVASARVIFEMSGLKTKLSVFDTLDQALEYARENRVEPRT
jgi:anti-anti-sigma factor